MKRTKTKTKTGNDWFQSYLKSLWQNFDISDDYEFANLEMFLHLYNQQWLVPVLFNQCLMCEKPFFLIFVIINETSSKVKRTQAVDYLACDPFSWKHKKKWKSWEIVEEEKVYKVYEQIEEEKKKKEKKQLKERLERYGHNLVSLSSHTRVTSRRSCHHIGQGHVYIGPGSNRNWRCWHSLYFYFGSGVWDVFWEVSMWDLQGSDESPLDVSWISYHHIAA